MNNTDEIEFSRVRKLVSHYAVSPEAKDKILIQPLATKLVKATALLDETAEMVWILPPLARRYELCSLYLPVGVFHRKGALRWNVVREAGLEPARA